MKNQRLAAVGYVWAFSALTASPGARAHYDRRSQANERHTAAQRNLFNRIIGMLHHCLQIGQPYNEQKAFPHPSHQLIRRPPLDMLSAWEVYIASRSVGRPGHAFVAELSSESAKTTANDESRKNGKREEAEQHDGQGPPRARDGEVPHQGH